MQKKIYALLTVAVCCFALLICTACGTEANTIRVNTEKTYQTMGGFGASAAWWAQDVGGWTENTENGNEIRTEILELLYGDNGRDLDIYRYNRGAGSKT